MSLVSLKPLLKDAKSKGYAVGAFNMLSIETVRGAIKAAEELNSPMILMLAEVHMPFAPMEYLAPVMVDAAKNAKVPVAVHFDHGLSFESTAKAIKSGFSSVMFDGSNLPIDENIRMTREIGKMAQSMGIAIEAELGHVGLAEDGNEYTLSHLTDVKEAVRFTGETDVDALAVSIGNLHGQYKEDPCLRFDRLEELKNAVAAPLVLHGGTGISPDDFKKCIKCGMTKVNIGTAVLAASFNKMKESANDGKGGYLGAVNNIAQGAYEAIKEHILIFGSNGKA